MEFNTIEYNKLSTLQQCQTWRTYLARFPRRLLKSVLNIGICVYRILYTSLHNAVPQPERSLQQPYIASIGELLPKPLLKE